MLDRMKGLFDTLTGAEQSTITVNGRTFKGNTVSIVGGDIIVDGKKVDSPEEKEINVTITGNVKELYLDGGTITMHGNVGDLSVAHAKTIINGDIKNNVRIQHGNMECDNIYSDVETNHGNVRAVTIHGSVSTKMGNITR